jgi:F0F1-type ATP synthase gamma subunit
VIYNGYISAMTQEVRHETLLPLQHADILGEEDRGQRTEDRDVRRSVASF